MITIWGWRGRGMFKWLQSEDGGEEGCSNDYNLRMNGKGDVQMHPQIVIIWTSPSPSSSDCNHLNTPGRGMFKWLQAEDGGEGGCSNDYNLRMEGKGDVQMIAIWGWWGRGVFKWLQSEDGGEGGCSNDYNQSFEHPPSPSSSDCNHLNTPLPLHPQIVIIWTSPFPFILRL
jgi:hypothetical protein